MFKNFLPIALGSRLVALPWHAARKALKPNLMALLLAILLTSHLAKSQTPYSPSTQVHLGKMHFVQNNLMPTQIVGSDDNGVFITKTKLRQELRGEEDFPVLEYYNNEMELQMFRKLTPPQIGAKPIFEKIMELEENLYCFYSLVDNKTDTKALLAQKVDKNTLSLEDEIFTLRTIPQTKNHTPFIIKPSFEGNSLMVIDHPDDKGNGQENIHLTVLDKNLQNQCRQDFVLPYKGDAFEIINYFLNNAGDFFLLAKTATRKKDLEKFWEPNYQFSILTFNKNAKSLKEYVPELDGKFLVNMQIGTSSSGELICGGFYQDQGPGNTAGSYFIQLDPSNGKVSKTNFKAFDPDILDQENDKVYPKEEMELYTYSPSEFYVRIDGGVVMIAEQATQTAHFDQRSNLPSAQISYNHIAVTSIAPDGEIMWTRKIQKYQTSSQRYSFFSSYATAVLHDKIYLVFNDNVQNQCKSTCKPVQFSPNSSKKDILIAMVEIGWDGEVNKSMISMSKDLNILTKPSACKQISRNEMVVLGQYNNEYRLAVLEFEKTFSYQY